MKWMGTFLILLFLCQVAPHPHTAHPHAHAHADQVPTSCGTHAAGHHDPFDGDEDPTHHAHDLTHHLVLKAKSPAPRAVSLRTVQVYLADVPGAVDTPHRTLEGAPAPGFPAPRPGHATACASRAPPAWS